MPLLLDLAVCCSLMELDLGLVSADLADAVVSSTARHAQQYASRFIFVYLWKEIGVMIH
jgi:hypothetical protein